MKEEKNRCFWCEGDPLYENYHDQEWGAPVYDDERLFEMLILEGFQAGLSWITILRRRENFRKAFDHFNIKKILAYGEEKHEELMQNEGIIRNRLKIRSVKTNAEAFVKVQKEFGSFSAYLWGFTNGKTLVNLPKTKADMLATSPLSDKISKDMKKRGFKFVGSTIIYAYLQAIGIINDHFYDCFKEEMAEKGDEKIKKEDDK